MGNRTIKQCPYFNEGTTTRFAFVFSCPGQKEKERPVSGATGENLNKLLMVFEEYGLIDVFEDRYNFRITNAYSEPLFIKKDGRTEARNAQIEAEDNLIRLHEDLNDITSYIICFGSKAKFAIDLMMEKFPLKSKPVIVYTNHLGFMSLNQIKLDKSLDNRTKRRIRTLFERDILPKIKR
jgi:hypothetical protein